MKVRFLKPFGKYQAGDTTEVGNDRSFYWRMIGLAEPVFETKEAVKSEAAPIVAEKSAEKATTNKKPEKVQIKKPPSKKRIKKPGS